MAASDATESRETLVIVGYTVPIAILVMSTVLRLWVKITQDRLHLDDYLITLASALEVAYSVTMLVCGVGHGFGKHTKPLDTHDLEIFLKGDYIASHLYNVGLAAIKLGILALYYRIFPVRWFSRTVIGCAIFVCVWITTIEVFMGALCRPLRAFWDLSIKGYCFNSTALSYYVNTSNMITDLVLFALPIPVILRVRTTRNKKIALVAIFSIGFITCGISAARLAYVVAQGSADITWEGVPLGVLSAFESLGAILCANLPIIYRLFRTAAQKITSSASRAKTSNMQYGYETKAYGTRSHARQHRRSMTDSERWIHANSSNENHAYAQGKISTEMKVEPGVFEMGRVPSGAIGVQREFHQSVEENTGL
ncbi:integral membrane PTH11-like protein [Aspergillus leporis]|uniref:Integral membrane PTH11-like protein n=1 Tax=Aspergillus leporis TaxID=41062 RepID=A0A5N5XG88_9EURO|nr:integral membrane PTH11-like protein [Aspergillus leporis]